MALQTTQSDVYGDNVARNQPTVYERRIPMQCFEVFCRGVFVCMCQCAYGMALLAAVNVYGVSARHSIVQHDRRSQREREQQQQHRRFTKPGTRRDTQRSGRRVVVGLFSVFAFV